MNILGDLLAYFSEKKYSFTSKIFVVLFAIASIFIINNILGFSFYYSNNQKITQLQNIESVKKDCSDPEVYNSLVLIEKDIINRKNIVESFFELFSKDPLDQKQLVKETSIDTVYVLKTDTIYIIQEYIYDTNNYVNPFDKFIRDTIKRSFCSNDSLVINKDTIVQLKNDTVFENPKTSKSINSSTKSRSQLWHTISSSFGFILLLIILPIIPFTQDKFSWNLVLGMILFMFIDAGLIWLNQYIFGLIPLIFGMPWINYVLNAIIHFLFWSIIALLSNDVKEKGKYKSN